MVNKYMGVNNDVRLFSKIKNEAENSQRFHIRKTPILTNHISPNI